MGPSASGGKLELLLAKSLRVVHESGAPQTKDWVTVERPIGNQPEMRFTFGWQFRRSERK